MTNRLLQYEDNTRNVYAPRRCIDQPAQSSSRRSMARPGVLAESIASDWDISLQEGHGQGLVEVVSANRLAWVSPDGVEGAEQAQAASAQG